MYTKGQCRVFFCRCVDVSSLLPLSRRGLWFCSRSYGISVYQVIIGCLSLWCCWRFLPLFLVRRSIPALETVGVVPDGPESRCGMQIFLPSSILDRIRFRVVVCFPDGSPAAPDADFGACGPPPWPSVSARADFRAAPGPSVRCRLSPFSFFEVCRCPRYRE